jgi:hypothetical protein
MKKSGWRWCALFFALVAALAGCGGSSNGGPSGSVGTTTKLPSGWSSTKIDAAADGRVTAVSCAKGGFCVAIDGSHGAAAVLSGSHWSTPTTIDSAKVTGVSCATARLCEAVDSRGDAVEWNGLSWSQPTAIDTIRAAKTADQLGANDIVLDAQVSPSLTAVSCSQGFCVAVDNQGQEVTWDGTSWGTPQPIEPTAVAFTAISCTFEPSCTAVDANGDAVYGSGNQLLVLRGLGLAWSPVQRVDASGGLSSISCASPYICEAVDSHGNALGWSPGTWTSPTSVDTGQDLTSISCSSSTACTAVDTAGSEVTWNGTSWSAPTPVTGNGAGMPAVTCAAPNQCFAASGQDVDAESGS